MLHVKRIMKQKEKNKFEFIDFFLLYIADSSVKNKKRKRRNREKFYTKKTEITLFILLI